MKSRVKLALALGIGTLFLSSSLGFSQQVPPANETATPAAEKDSSACEGQKVEGMQCIPAGMFLRGEDGKFKSTRPQERVELDAFFMDTYEVTSGEYQACVAEGSCKKAGPNYSDFSADRQPVTGVNWFHANSFCRAHGKHLPTEAEWEKAARGEQGAQFSWGDEPATCKRAVVKNRKGRSCGKLKKGRSGKPEVGRPEVVGSKPPGSYGLYDMAGNSWEWVADWYSPSYKKCGQACQGKNPKGLCEGAERCKSSKRKVVRGGSWYWPASYSTAFYRRAHVPNNRPFHHFGFRCAASMEEARLLTTHPAH